MKYKYVGTDIDVPDNFEEWHIQLLLDYKRIYETPWNNTQANSTSLSLNKDLTEFNKLNSQMTLQVTSLNPDIMFNKNGGLTDDN